MVPIKTLEGLEARIRQLVGNPGSKTAIIAGHYPLSFSDGKVRAEVGNEETFGIFPQYTFELGCKTVAQTRGIRDCRLVLVADDHSLMPDKRWYNNPNTELGSKIADYFGDFRIPVEFQEIMQRQRVSEQDFAFSPKGLAFQESNFRREFEERYKIPSGCAGEYQLVLEYLANNGFEKVIGFIPLRCKNPTICAVVKHNAQNPGKIIRAMQFYFPTSDEITSKEELQKEIDKIGEIPAMN